ncbi:hypothetical protein RhiirA4_488116, partial [Rhizophagus irregularis]
LKITDEIETAYKFQLLFRGSHHRFAGKNFHEICDNQSRTITIIKLEGSTEILGGYNPIEWKSDDSFGVTKDSFVFSFKNSYDIESHILSRVKNERFAIRNYHNSGPSFGYSLALTDGFGFCSNCVYEKQIRKSTDYFCVKEYEYYDVTIEDGNDPYVRIFRAYMVILHYRSTYLQKILTTNKRKNYGTLVHIKLPIISPDIILRYIYGGSISLDEHGIRNIIDIFVAGSKLDLQELIDYLQSFLIENKANLDGTKF